MVAFSHGGISFMILVIHQVTQRETETTASNMKREYEGEGTMSCTHLESASSQSSLQASVQLGVVVTCSYTRKNSLLTNKTILVLSGSRRRCLRTTICGGQEMFTVHPESLENIVELYFKDWYKCIIFINIFQLLGSNGLCLLIYLQSVNVCCPRFSSAWAKAKAEIILS